MVSGDRIIEDAGARPNSETSAALYRREAKWQTEEGKEICRQRKKVVELVFRQVKFNLDLADST